MNVLRPWKLMSVITCAATDRRICHRKNWTGSVITVNYSTYDAEDEDGI